jgi:hypothetical protein
MSELVIILIFFTAILYMYATGSMGGIPKLLKLVEHKDFDTSEFDCKKHKVAYEALLEHEEGDDSKIDLLFEHVYTAYTLKEVQAKLTAVLKKCPEVPNSSATTPATTTAATTTVASTTPATTTVASIRAPCTPWCRLPSMTAVSEINSDGLPSVKLTIYSNGYNVAWTSCKVTWKSRIYENYGKWNGWSKPPENITYSDSGVSEQEFIFNTSRSNFYYQFRAIFVYPSGILSHGTGLTIEARVFQMP